MFPEGFAELSVIMNAAPTGGFVEAFPRAGSAAVDKFSLQSLEWTDVVDDLPLLYSFAYVNDQVRRPSCCVPEHFPCMLSHVMP